MFEKFALVVLLIAQAYRIVRSELLIKREREILERQTPAGLWPQYEALKKFYEELQDLLKKTQRDLETTRDELSTSRLREQEDLASVVSFQKQLEQLSRNLGMIELNVDRRTDEIEKDLAWHFKNAGFPPEE